MCMFCRSLFVLLSFFFWLLCFCPSSIYEFWWPFWYLQALRIYILFWSGFIWQTYSIFLWFDMVNIVEPYLHVRFMTLNPSSKKPLPADAICLRRHNYVLFILSWLGTWKSFETIYCTLVCFFIDRINRLSIFIYI